MENLYCNIYCSVLYFFSVPSLVFSWRMRRVPLDSHLDESGDDKGDGDKHSPGDDLLQGSSQKAALA